MATWYLCNCSDEVIAASNFVGTASYIIKALCVNVRMLRLDCLTFMYCLVPFVSIPIYKCLVCIDILATIRVLRCT